MMSLWDALRMNMMISYQELVRTFLNEQVQNPTFYPLIDSIQKHCDKIIIEGIENREHMGYCVRWGFGDYRGIFLNLSLLKMWIHCFSVETIKGAYAPLMYHPPVLL